MKGTGNPIERGETKLYFWALPQELLCQQICCFHGAAQEPALQPLVLITNHPISAAWWGLHPKRGIDIAPVFPSALQSLPRLLSGEKHPHLTLGWISATLQAPKLPFASPLSILMCCQSLLLFTWVKRSTKPHVKFK